MQACFHERLKRLREAKGWNLRHLAKKCHVSEEHLAVLEADSRHVPTWRDISRLASALGINPVYLASGAGKPGLFRIPHDGHQAETGTGHSRKA